MPDGSFCMECGYSEKYCTCHEDVEWNDGYYFEAMDRCHTMMVMISEILDGHPAIQKVGVQKNIDKAVENIMHAYQKLGEADFYKDEE